MLDEIDTTEEVKRPNLSDCLIDVNQLTVKWPAAGDTEDNTLTDLTFTVRPGQLLAVIGQVGAGKVLIHILYLFFSKTDYTYLNLFI